MSLKERITEEMKAALRAKDSETLQAIRMLRAAIQRREVDERISLDDAGVVGVIQKQVKQSQDAIAQFNQGDRPDLAAKEQKSIDVLRSYLPAPLSDVEIEALIDAAVRETGAASVRDMGKVMANLKQQTAGRADMAAVSTRVKTRLSSG
ncbi:MAG: GatB/YqeY domain-containing protein [Gammaproteobacteria bacterium]|nr:GatB/YqeY domain-containing protein [Gammaproteobacteria bacterium]